MTVAALHAVAAYVVAPARHRATGRIGLVPTPTGFATPPLPGGGVVAVDGTDLVRADGARAPLTTLRRAAAFVGVELESRPPIGRDLPPLRPDDLLALDADAVADVASWWTLGVEVLDELRRTYPAADISQEQLWPEHFDLATVVTLADGSRVNVGFSPGDDFVDGPYAYVGPQDHHGADRSWWNAPFGATRRRPELLGEDPDDPVGAVVRFVRWGLRRSEAAADAP